MVRAAAAAALTRRPHPKLAPFLAKALSDPDRDVRLHAVKGLGLCEQPAVAPQLRPLLSCGDEELELAAAESMARLGDDRIVPDMLDRLQREMQNPGSEPGTEKIVDALRRLRDGRAVLPVVELLRHPRDVIRARAAEALGQIGDPAALDSLTDLLQRDFTAKVQAAAAKALGELKDPQAIPALELALQHSSHVRCKALIALGEIGGKRALRSLIELTEDPAPTVRYHAANTLAKAGDRSAVPALESLTRDSDEMVRRSAVKALQELGDDRSPEEISRSAQLPAGPDQPPAVKRPRPRFTVQQLLPDVLLGLSSRKIAIYGGGLIAAAVLVALAVRVGRNWQTDTVVVRGYVSDVSLSGDGRAAAVMRTLGLFEVWDAVEHEATHQSPNLRFREVFFAPDGSSLLGVGGNSLTLMQFDSAHQVISQVSFQAPGETVTAVGTSPSGARVATVSNTGELVCWNIQSGAGEWTLQLPDGELQSLAVTEEGDRTAGVSSRGELFVWDVATGELAGEYAFSGPPPLIRGLSFDSAGELLAAGTVTGDLYIWNTDDLRKPRIRPGQGRPAQILRFVDAEHLLVHRGNAFETWSVEEEQPRSFSIDADLEGSLAAAATLDGSRIAVGADESSALYVYDVPSGELQFKLFEE
jgi:HEAT repeat protein